MEPVKVCGPGHLLRPTRVTLISQPNPLILVGKSLDDPGGRQPEAIHRLSIGEPGLWGSGWESRGLLMTDDCTVAFPAPSCHQPLSFPSALERGIYKR